jgi:hypothetical protein
MGGFVVRHCNRARLLTALPLCYSHEVNEKKTKILQGPEISGAKLQFFPFSFFFFFFFFSSLLLLLLLLFL